MNMRRFLIVIEKSEDGGFGAYSPDLPGCVAVGATREETEANMYQAIALHLAGLRQDDLPVPAGESLAEYVVIPENVGAS